MEGHSGILRATPVRPSLDRRTLPEILKDPEFLQRTNMEVLDTAGNVVDPQMVDLVDPTRYRLRQCPGPDNSLGLVKFMFPDEYHIYLHDAVGLALRTREPILQP